MANKECLKITILSMMVFALVLLLWESSQLSNDTSSFMTRNASDIRPETRRNLATSFIGNRSHAEANSEIYIDDLKQMLDSVRILKRNVPVEGRCTSLIPGRRILINYASHCCAKSQLQNCLTGLKVGGFDVCISFTEKSLDPVFTERNKKILSGGRGAGFWLWKPYIILRTLSAMTKDDVMFYCDSGSHFIRSMDQTHICLMSELKKDIILYSDPHKERVVTKADAFFFMGINSSDPKFTDTDQRLGGFVLARKTFTSLKFVGEWLTYAQDYRIIANDPSKYEPTLEGFRSHRNDQSIGSLLTKRWDIEVFPDLTQFGERAPNAETRKLERYRLINETVIKLTRSKV